jgi:hypothetical protein
MADKAWFIGLFGGVIYIFSVNNFFLATNQNPIKFVLDNWNFCFATNYTPIYLVFKKALFL